MTQDFYTELFWWCWAKQQINQIATKKCKEANPPGDMNLWMSKLKVREGFNQLCLQPPQAREHLPKSNIFADVEKKFQQTKDWRVIAAFPEIELFLHDSPGQNSGVGIFQ